MHTHLPLSLHAEVIGQPRCLLQQVIPMHFPAGRLRSHRQPMATPQTLVLELSDTL